MSAITRCPVSEDELATLAEMSDREHPVEFEFYFGGPSKLLAKDGMKGPMRWAMIALAEMRGSELSPELVAEIADLKAKIR